MTKAETKQIKLAIRHLERMISEKPDTRNNSSCVFFGNLSGVPEEQALRIQEHVRRYVDSWVIHRLRAVIDTDRTVLNELNKLFEF